MARPPLFKARGYFMPVNFAKVRHTSDDKRRSIFFEPCSRGAFSRATPFTKHAWQHSASSRAEGTALKVKALEYTRISAGKSTRCIASKPKLMAMPPLFKAQAYFMPTNLAKVCSPCNQKFSSQHVCW